MQTVPSLAGVQQGSLGGGNGGAGAVPPGQGKLLVAFGTAVLAQGLLPEAAIPAIQRGVEFGFDLVVLAGALGLAFQVARRSTRSTDQTQLMGVLQSKVDLAATISFDSLSLITGCDTTTTGNVKIIGCVTITSSSTRLKDVMVVVKTTVPTGRPDTVRLTRAKPRQTIPIT